jgi:hypothetical protein
VPFFNGLLDVPLHSDKGQIALASLIDWSGDKKIDRVLFIPLSGEELKEVRRMFVNDVVPGQQAEIGHDGRILDRISRKEGTAAGILGIGITNDEGVVILKILPRNGGATVLKLRLVRTNARWQVQEHNALSIGDGVFPRPRNVPPKQRILEKE